MQPSVKYAKSLDSTPEPQTAHGTVTDQRSVGDLALSRFLRAWRYLRRARHERSDTSPRRVVREYSAPLLSISSKVSNAFHESHI